MTSDERLRLAQRRGQARFVSFDEQTVPQTGFNTLDESLWKPLLSAEGAAEPESALGKLALLLPDETGTPRATVAGVLLCTRNSEQWLPNACLTATRYRGKDRTSGQIDAQEITGPLNRQIADAVAFAVRNMRVAARNGRTYLYASNVAINHGQAQPVRFGFGEHLRLTDADANDLDVRIVHIEGRSVLVEYRRIEP